MLLRSVRTINLLFRRNYSALYVTGDKAKENYAVLTPYMDFEKKLAGNFQEIEENIRRRKLKIDLEAIKTEWDLYQAIQTRKKNMETRRAEIAKQMKETSDEGLKIQGKQLREDLKLLKENSYYLEDQFTNNFLSLPNDIHRNTSDEQEILFEHLKAPETETCSSQKLEKYFEFIDPFRCYGKGEAAKFDIFCSIYANDFFRNNDFILFSNPDFSRSVIVEGAGSEPNDELLLKEEDIENKVNLLHLTGKASLKSYLAFVTKLTVFPNAFPLKFVTIGKQYQPPNDRESNDLYNLVQNTCCQIFLSVIDETTVDATVEETLEIYKQFYSKFNQHFRIVRYPADKLSRSESMKICVEMFSQLKNSYVQVGDLSVHGDFISKRLLFNCRDGKELKFPQIISGTPVNVTKLLNVLIENCSESGDFKCPDFIL